MRITYDPAASVRPVALVFDPIRRADWSYEEERAILAAAGVDLAIPADADTALAAAPTADVIVVSSRLPGDVIQLLGRCCGIVCYSVGTDGVDVGLASEAGIPVRNVPDYCTEEVADHAMALILSAERRIVQFADVTRSGQWASRRVELVTGIRRSSRRTIGVVGLGRIGSRVAAKCHGLGMHVIGYDPVAPHGPETPDRVETLDNLLSEADVVVLCAALTGSSRRLLDERAFGRMRQGAGLVNVARGALVDESALLDALESGHVGWAALDVRDPEPPIPNDPLNAHPNVIATPHVGATSMDAWADLHRGAAAQVLSVLESAGRLSVSRR